MKSRINIDLIELSDNDSDIEEIKYDSPRNKIEQSIINKQLDTVDNNYDIVLIEKENTEIDEPKVMDFVKFCIKRGLFDDTFYDYGNAFSVVATKLPRTFEKLSTDGENIRKNAFVRGFSKNFRYKGDIEFIYEYIDKDKKGFITWEEFTDFYLPFIKYTTI